MTVEAWDASEFLSATTRDAAHRLSSRMMIEDHKIPLVSLPLGGEEGLDPILSFVPLARVGFTQDLKADSIIKQQIPDLLEMTKPTSYAIIFREIQDMNIDISPRITDKDPSLVIFRHTLSTIILLSSLKRVDLRKLDSENYKLVGDESYWPYQPSVENVWDLLEEIEDSTNQMILGKEEISKRNSALRATHFFAAGNKLAKSLSSN